MKETRLFSMKGSQALAEVITCARSRDVSLMHGKTVKQKPFSGMKHP
jgi:hypothetical protein